MTRRTPAIPALALLFALGPAPTPSAAQVADYVPEPARGQAFELSIRNIMQGPAHVGEAPSSVSFTDDGAWIYFRWKVGGGAWNDEQQWYRVAATGGAPELVPEADLPEARRRFGSGDLSSDRRLRVMSDGGDLFLIDRGSMQVTRLTETRAAYVQPLFMTGDDRILYREGMNLFSMDLNGAGVRQLTDIRSGSPPAESEPEGLQAFLRDQQLELFEHIRRQKAERDSAEARRERARAGEPETVWIPQGENVGGLTPTRDGRHVLLTTSRPARGAKQVPVPFWVTESGYTESREVRTKVGDETGGGRAGLLRVETGEVTWLDAGPDDFEGEVRTMTGSWNDAGTHALVLGISDDDENRWIYALNAATGELTLLDHLQDSAWVGGPCGFCSGWLPGTATAYYVSETTGYAHVYAVNADGTGRRPLTSGDWEVLGLTMPESRDRFLVTTHEDSPFNQHVGWLSFQGGAIEYLTEGDGRYDVTLSPDGRRLAIVHDVANAPGELFVAAAGSPGSMERVTTTPTDVWVSFPWIRPEIVHIQAEDGTMVPARIYRPADVGGSGNGAAVVFVHGAGYLHNVHNYWSSYYREYMFHHFLAAQGYTVLDIDYRGSAGYGRDWRTAIYRWMGGKDLSDQVDGARWLVANEGIDPARIGIYGGSYGGFITLMALFTADDTFKSGAALRSVTDWAHYNDGYTSNILNDPQEDEEAYERSSPIYFAENFGPDQYLLIPHGMVDTNVHFSDVVRLAQRLIELGKENWEMAVYPVENHGFVEPSSWTDEYRRIFELFERTISRPGCTEGGAFCAVPGR
jgi:dipeptidyl aminopeptidase/acylaminoacyl peptidase